MIKSIGHVAFVAKDMEKSLEYYCEILGFKKAFEIKDENGQPWINYIKVTDGQFIELFYGGKESKNSQDAAGFSHLCLEVDDIYEIADLLEKHNLLDIKPNQGKDLNYQCWSKDPDGNRIEFMQMEPDSPQSKS